MAEKIIQVNALDQYKKDKTRYAITSNRIRAIPDIRDGLKTVHRRILEAMLDANITTSHTVKCVRIVGDTLGKYHPHGDTSVYGAMKPMSNWFEINIPLIEKQGNFGNFHGDGAAAMRYTEATMSKYALNCIVSELTDVSATAKWKPNFDETRMEIDAFPSKVPNLLINGSFGIGIGIKSEIPKHNINDVIDATLKLIANPNAEIVLVPEHCMPVQILDTNFKSISNKGYGHYTARAIIDIEQHGDRHHLIIKSLPDMVSLNTIIGNEAKKAKKLEDGAKASNINSLILNKVIQVDRMDDESTEFQPWFRIVLKKGADPEYTREVLYKSTQLEKRYTVNFEALNGIDRVRCSYKEYLLEFIEYRKLVKFILYSNKYQEFATKFHEKDAFLKVMQSGEIDKVADLIRNQSEIDDSATMEYLITRFKMTDLQARFIMNVQFKRLSLGYLNQYIEEAKVYTEQMDFYLNKILDETEILNDIVNELLEVKRVYGVPKRAIIVQSKNAALIPKGDFKIIVTENNFIKKIPANFDNTQLSKDKPIAFIKGCNTESILLFDDRGRVYKLPISKIPISDKSGPGEDIRSLIKTLTSNIIKVMYEPKVIELSKSLDKYWLTIVTRNGNIKKMDLDDFITVPASGIIYSKLDQTDFVKSIVIVHDAFDVVVYSKTDALRMNMMDVPHQKRNNMGLKSMASADFIDGISIISPDSTSVIVVTEKGYVNMFDSVALPRLTRNKPGNKVIKLTRGDSIKSILVFHMDDTKFLKVMLSNNDEFNIGCSSIESGSSISSGKKLIPVNNNNIMAAGIVLGE